MVEGQAKDDEHGLSIRAARSSRLKKMTEIGVDVISFPRAFTNVRYICVSLASQSKLRGADSPSAGSAKTSFRTTASRRPACASSFSMMCES